MSCSELFSFNSSSISQFEFLMQWHFLFSFSDIEVIFILVYAFSFDHDEYFPYYGKTKFFHLGFLFWNYLSDRKYLMCNVYILVGIFTCF
jgi:hypothetical protein